MFVCLFVLFRECNCLRRQELLLLLCGTQVLFGSIFLLLALIFSAFVISWMDIPSSKEAFTPGECNSFFGNGVLSFVVLALRIRFCHFSIYFVCWIFFSAFYYLICFLIFCHAFRLRRSFVNRYFAILTRFQCLVFPCFLSLYSWGRAASSERTIAIIVCMFCGPFVFTHGCYMTREFRRESLIYVPESTVEATHHTTCGRDI